MTAPKLREAPIPLSKPKNMDSFPGVLWRILADKNTTTNRQAAAELGITLDALWDIMDGKSTSVTQKMIEDLQWRGILQRNHPAGWHSYKTDFEIYRAKLPHGGAIAQRSWSDPKLDWHDAAALFVEHTLATQTSGERKNIAYVMKQTGQQLLRTPQIWDQIRDKTAKAGPTKSALKEIDRLLGDRSETARTQFQALINRCEDPRLR